MMRTGLSNVLMWSDFICGASVIHHEKNVPGERLVPEGKARGSDRTPTHSLQLSRPDTLQVSEKEVCVGLSC